MSEEPVISIIIPCYNEEATLSETLAAVTSQMEAAGHTYEILAVNDGSQDKTLECIEQAAEANPKILPIDLMRNFGQTTAYRVGLDQARGRSVILFSGDLEIPAEQILTVIQKLDDGYDFVNTFRKERWGGAHAFKSKWANLILNRISGLEIQDRGSGLKGMRREVAKSLQLYGEWHRFLPDLATLYTSRIVEFEVPFEERKAGISSYQGKRKTLSVFLDLATVAFTLLSQRKPFQLLPGRFFGFTGLIIGSVGSAISAYLIIQKLFYGAALAERPLFMVSLLMAILGVIMVMIGMLGELMMQIWTLVHPSKEHCIRRKH